MYEWIGQFLGQFPVWVGMPIAAFIVIAVWIVWFLYVDPIGSEIVERRRNRRRREKEIEDGKK